MKIYQSNSIDSHQRIMYVDRRKMVRAECLLETFPVGTKYSSS